MTDYLTFYPSIISNNGILYIQLNITTWRNVTTHWPIFLSSNKQFDGLTFGITTQ